MQFTQWHSLVATLQLLALSGSNILTVAPWADYAPKCAYNMFYCSSLPSPNMLALCLHTVHNYECTITCLSHDGVGWLFLHGRMPARSFSSLPTLFCLWRGFFLYSEQQQSTRSILKQHWWCSTTILGYSDEWKMRLKNTLVVVSIEIQSSRVYRLLLFTVYTCRTSFARAA